MKLPFLTPARLLLLGGALVGLASAPAQAQVDNYAFTALNQAYVPLTATATVVTFANPDDDVSGVLPLGFTFAFDGTPYSSVVASTNGFLSFNTAATSSLNNDLDNGGFTPTPGIRPLVAPLWDDLEETMGAGEGRYLTTGTAPNRVFTFEWYQWAWNYTATSATVSFQVRLYEGTNVVEFHYRPEGSAPTNPSASIGLAGVGMGSGSFLSVNSLTPTTSVSSITESDMISTAPVSGQLYRFTPPVPSPCPIPRNLTATVSGVTANVAWTVISGGGTFSVVYGPAGFNPAMGGTTIGPITGTSATIPNLIPGNYQFYVRQNCGGAAGNSPLSNPGSIVVACPSATNLAAGTLTNTTAAISWVSPLASGVTFNVVYGAPGFMPGSGGTSITGLTGTSTTITGLMPSTTYDVYVQLVCVGGGTGMITGPITISTPLTIPGNDDPCGALPLGIGLTTGTNSGATTSLQNGITPPVCTPSVSPKDVWFSFTPSGTSVTLNVSGTVAGMVRTYGSPDCANGPFVLAGCTGATGPNVGINGPVSLTGLTPSARYYVGVSGYGSSDTNGTFTIQVLSGLGTSVRTETAALQIYPNPSRTGWLTLRLGLGTAGQATLVNAVGQTVRAVRLGGNVTEHQLSTAGLAAGIYTLQVATGREVLTRKVVLE